jgi:serine/threonine-protein kinase
LPSGGRLDRYEIRELIAEGGMGAIYRAIDTKLGRTVALKTLRGSRLSSGSGEEARRRFMREALAASKVEHRNVVRVFDFGVASDGTPYLAMEYLKGRDLGELVERSADLLPVSEVIDVMLSVCAAVRACHDAGVIHRDLKPSNIFLCDTDSGREVKVLDFGVSKTPVAGNLTQEGQILGTPQFLSPEQIDGKALPQTDQYAVGVVLYACLTKALPYEDHGNLSLLRAIDLGKFLPPRAHRPDLPAQLEAIILRAMRTAPEQRFESMHALGQQLWPFASAQAREQWRPYYFDNPPMPSAKASTIGVSELEKMLRDMPAAVMPSMDSLGAASTATMLPAAAGKRGGTPAKLAAVGASAGINVRRRSGWRLPGWIVVALAVGGAAWLLVERRWNQAGRAPAPAAVPPVAAPSPLPAAVALPPRPAAPTPAPARVPVAAPSARAQEPAPRPAPPRRDKQRRRNISPPSVEYTPDGVPIMP